MIRHILIILTCIVSILLIGIIFFQSPRQESLSNAFNGEKVYVSSFTNFNTSIIVGNTKTDIIYIHKKVDVASIFLVV